MTDTLARETPPPPAAESPRLALRPKEAAAALGIGVRLLWEKTISQEIPCVRIGRAVLYPVVELQRWLSEQATGGKEVRR